MLTRWMRTGASSIVWPLCALRARARRGREIRVLTYHRVNPFHPWDRLSVAPENFRAQLRWLKERGYAALGVDGLLRARASGSFGRSVVLTFDDGYRDNYEFAYPILREFGFTAVFYLTAGHIGTDHVFTRYAGKAGDNRLLSWGEAAEMSAGGMEFGSHTMSHVLLAGASPDEAKKEITGSLEILQSRSLPGKSFCYPGGSYNAEIARVVAVAGYDCAFTTKPGAVTRATPPYELTRTEISGFDTLLDFRKKLAGAYDLQHRILQRFQSAY